MNRIDRLRERMAQKNLDALLVTTPENRRYLSGFAGSAGWLVVTARGVALATDGRYWTTVEENCPQLELLKFHAPRDQRLGVVVRPWLNGTRKLGFESRNLTVADLEDLRGDFEGIELEPTQELVEDLRQVKEPEELDKLRHAAAIADRAFQTALKILEPGVRESDLCAELEYQLQKEGARKPSFDSIVASGPNGAYPHAGVTDRPIQEGELITMDFGALCDGYNSDITRTVWLGELPAEQEKIYRTVREAQSKALRNVKPGKTTGFVDEVARYVINRAGYGEAFSHGLGHGLGLAVHELPRMRPGGETVLEPGMVVTVEPGIYLPGVGGCRVEDSVIVTEDGFEYLTHAPYQESGPHPLS